MFLINLELLNFLYNGDYFGTCGMLEIVALPKKTLGTDNSSSAS